MFFRLQTREQDLNNFNEYVKVDGTKAKKDLKAVDSQIADLQSQLDELRGRKAMLERVVAMATGDIDVGRLSKSKSSRDSTTKGESIDPQKIVDFLKENGGTATLDELKQALRVGGRVIGGALRKDDRLTKDSDGNYTVNT